MTTMFRHHLPGAVAAAAVLAACTGDADTDQSGGQVDGPTRDDRPWATGPSVEVVLEAASSDDLLVSSVQEIAVDSREQVYLIDFDHDGIVMLDPGLAYLGTIGREGEGPGEFMSPSGIQALPGDSLMVWDSQLQRITVFPPGSDEPAYIRALGTPESSQDTWRLTGLGSYLARSSTAYRADGSDQGTTRLEVLRHVREEAGRVVDEVVADYPANESLVFRREGFVMAGRHPFGRRSFVGILGGERIVHATSDAVAVRIIDLEGQVEHGFAYETTPARVTREELNEAVEETSGALGRILREGAPYVWPTLTDLEVDDEDRIWLSIPGTDRSLVEWAAFMPDGTHLVSVDLPSEFVVHAVRGGRIIGAEEDEMGVPQVLAYRLP